MLYQRIKEKGDIATDISLRDILMFGWVGMGIGIR